jgi:phage terminase Nu1 subunit (DNA packaging protein)
MNFVDVARVARALNLDERRVQQLVKQGMPREQRGRYDAMKCMLWYIRFLQATLEKSAISTDPRGAATERQARVRKIRADADMKELELARVQAGLVSIEDVARAAADLVGVTKARVMAIAPRLAPELLGETSRVMVQAKLEKALKETLAQLARRGG